MKDESAQILDSLFKLSLETRKIVQHKQNKIFNKELSLV